jgi:hypothetical protein
LFILATTAQLKEAKFSYYAGLSSGSERMSHLLLAIEASCWGLLACSFFLGLLWFKLFWFAWILLALGTRLSRLSADNACASAEPA